LLDLEQDDEFKGAHDEIVDFFNRQFEILAAGGGDKTSAATLQVMHNMCLPEVGSLCLGYGRFGVDGSGAGTKLATSMVSAMLFAIGAGLRNVKHFEEIGILRGGIGPDRISDATANIIKWRLAAYTTRMCDALDVPTSDVVLDHAKYDMSQKRWISISARLPVRGHSKRPVLLVPKRFLRHLPTLSGEEFKEFAVRKYQDAHKNDLNKKVLTAVDKDNILSQARASEATRGEFINAATSTGSHPYDFDKDPWGLVSWEQVAREYVKSSPFKPKQATTDDEFKRFVRDIIAYFKHFVEEQKGWQLLWNDDGKPRREVASQRLFLGVAWLACRDNDIGIDPEANIGRGPVDFKFSRGFQKKALVETKLASNSQWMHGVTTQLPIYLNADKTEHGAFVLIKHQDRNDDAILKLQQAAEQVRKDKGLSIDVTVIDANRDRPSASKA
jgi:hypothetical protein